MVDAFNAEANRFEQLRSANIQRLRNDSRQLAEFTAGAIRTGSVNSTTARRILNRAVAPANNYNYNAALLAANTGSNRNLSTVDIRKRLENAQKRIADIRTRNQSSITAMRERSRELAIQQAEYNRQIEKQQQEAEETQIQENVANAALTGSRNPYEYLRPRFEAYGLGEIFEQLKSTFATIPEGNEQVVLGILRGTDAYKRRFRGMQTRLDNGLAPMDEGTYIATEASYKKSIESFGFNPNQLLVDEQGRKIDSRNAFATFIGKDVSPIELTGRLRAAEEWTKNVNPETKDLLRRFYGLQDKDLMTYALNPKGGQIELERVANTVRVGAEALSQGFDVLAAPQTTVSSDDRLSQGFIEDLATRSTEELRALTPERRADELRRSQLTAQESIARASEQRLGIERLADISGEDITSQEQVEAQFSEITGLTGGTGRAGTRARRRISRLRSQERARFGGAGTGTNIFSDNESGSF